jgi:hypothetical protein
MLLREALVYLIDDNPHSFEQFAALWRRGAMLKILRQYVKLLAEALKSVRSHKPVGLP